MQRLPNSLYTVDSVVQLEQIAIKQYNIPAYDLMKRAGEAVFNVLQKKYSQTKKVLILCGAGNNAGDGYVVATLAKQAGYKIQLVSLVEPETLKNEASLAYQDWLKCEGSVVTADIIRQTAKRRELLDDADVIIDALLGTGVKRDVSAEWAEWIRAVNESANQSVHQSKKSVIAIDIPSGLYADTGEIAGVAIKASCTVCFIGLKQGMFTAQGNDVCGEVLFNDLSLPDDVYERVKPDAELIQQVNYALLPKRKASSHKGNFGHVLIVGGNEGMPGAVILAARAALRCGAGLVTIITIPLHLDAIGSAVPEALVKVCDIDAVGKFFQQPFLDSVTQIAIGMGLGQDEWSMQLLNHCLQLHKPMVIDADALNLIAANDMVDIVALNAAPLVMTPHPGEATRLLSVDKSIEAEENKYVSSSDAQKDRFAAIKKIHTLFSTNNPSEVTIILKGSGTLIFNGKKIRVCKLGNSAMAAPGMGDVLSGMVVSLLAQNSMHQDVTVNDVAELAVCLHAAAAESFTGDKTRGLLASDVVDALANVLQ